MGGRFRRLYGATPLHLLALLASFALCAAALVRLVSVGSDAANVVVWFGGAVVAHDLLLFPLYSALDAVARRALLGSPPAEGHRRLLACNHVRFPLGLSALLLVVFAPSILRLGSTTYRTASGLTPDVYLSRWLALSGGLCVLSALAFALRPRRTGDQSKR